MLVMYNISKYLECILIKVYFQILFVNNVDGTLSINVNSY